LRVTASFLNSAVYACFGIFIVSPFMVTAIIHHPWKTKFRGKISLLRLRTVSLRDQRHPPPTPHAELTRAC
jgi:hypothetical protein